jgi:CubicO group peptidase (beta-lactamase class C family)
MFMLIFRFFLLFFFSFTCLESKTKDEIKAYNSKFEEQLNKIKDAYKAPGLAIAIIKDGHIVYEKTLGEKENGKKNPIDSDTVFQIASMTKNFLAFIIAQLVEEGVFTWETPVSKYLPELEFYNSDANKNITVLDLVTHRVGLPPFSGDSLWHAHFTQLELLGALKKIPFKEKFREKYTYQNHMFGAASLLVERATGKTIEDLFHERIFKPLKMINASASLKAVQPKFLGYFKSNFANPHDIRDGKIFAKPLLPHMYLFTGSTGINLSLNDAIIWVNFLLNDYTYDGKSFLKPETIKFLYDNKIECTFSEHETQFHKDRFSNTSYCVGAFKSQYGPDAKNILYGHMGGFNGVRSYFCFVPSEKLGIVILSNFGSMTVSLMPEVIRNTFLDWYFDLEKMDWIEKIYKKSQSYLEKYHQARMNNRLYNPTSAKSFNDYKGRYTHPVYGDVHITEDEKKLYMTYKDKKIPLTHWNGNEFSLKPFDLSPTYNDYDLCPIVFIFEPHKKKKLYIGQMTEGAQTFEKVDE